MSRNVVIVQARMGSTRLPGKVLMTLGGISALAQCLRRCQEIPGVDSVVCAIPFGAQDDPVAEEAARIDAIVTRGPADDVLRRYRMAAEAAHADIVIRVTSDCPLIDPDVCGQLLRLRARSNLDYASNNTPPSWPHGLDAEVFTFEALRQADESATEAFDREHVTPYLRREPRFRRGNLGHQEGDLSPHRWTLDYPEDYAFLNALFERLPPAPAIPSLAEVLTVLEDAPELSAINAMRVGVRAAAPVSQSDKTG
jgi:spore coat polysaccharide biosynthesis protein SpsF (cytidylyltransferase family)